MANIEEALKTAGAKEDLDIILQELEGDKIGFKRQEAAAGPFATMDTAGLTGLNLRRRTIVKTAQQQQGNPGRL